MVRTYNTTVQDIADEVRFLTQDTQADAYRTSNTEIIGWLNDALYSLLSLVPQLFVTTGTYTTSSGSRQVLDLSLAHTLVEVIGVPQADYASLSAFNPAWQSAASGTIQNWLRALNEPLGFFVYPPSAGGVSLTVLYVKAHTELTATTDTIQLSEVYKPALVAYCTAMVEAKEDENVDNNRAAQQMADFVGRITGGKA